MSLEENKAVVCRFIEELNKRNIAIMDELVAPDMVHPTLQVRGPENYKQFETALWKVFPDWHETVLDIVAEGDKVWLLAEVTATHEGEWRGIVPTGKRITFSSVQIWRLVDGMVFSLVVWAKKCSGEFWV